MTKRRTPFKSIHGKSLGINEYGSLSSNNGGTPVLMGSRAASAVITVSAEAATTANTRDISITLKDHNGETLDYAEQFEIVNFSSSAMTDWAGTGGSTGIAASTGNLLALVAKKHFKAITTTAGVWTGTYLDTGTDAGYLGIILPNGTKIAGALLTNA
jgi:hypothetical protein